MVNLTLRETGATPKGSPLSNAEIDQNFINLKDAVEAAVDHNHADATTSTSGFMSSIDKTKLDGIATGANNYTHPTEDGSLHVPATGATSNGKVLKAGATAGSAAWDTLTANEVGAEPSVSVGTTDQYFRGDKTWRDLFTDVRAATLTGLSTATNAVISATDTVLAALGKLQAQVSAKQDTLISGTSIKTVNSTSLLGSGDITIGGVTGQASSVDGEVALFSGTGGKTVKSATVSGLAKLTSGVLSAATAGTDFVAPGTATTFTATQTFKGIVETQYNLTGTDLMVSNGTIQYKTLTGNTSITESLADGQAVILMLNPGTFATTWPTTTWIGTAASTAPTLVASVYNCLVFFQMNGTLYGRYVGRV